MNATFDTKQLETFNEQGYLVLPSFLDADHCQRLRKDVDQLNADRETKPREELPHLVSYPELGLLTSDPALMEQLQSLMGERFAMHHIHAVRQDAGNPGVNWHHDYEQFPQCNRSHTMVHVFFYLNGLNGEIGDLLLIPGSHKNVMERHSLGAFQTSDLPGSMCVNDIPPGTAIIVHSALFHARRAKPGGENRSRYFIDISYCQDGIKWPNYNNQKSINDTALGLNLGRDGKYDFLYDSSQFYEKNDVLDAFHEKNIGSLCLKV